MNMYQTMQKLWC